MDFETYQHEAERTLPRRPLAEAIDMSMEAATKLATLAKTAPAEAEHLALKWRIQQLEDKLTLATMSLGLAGEAGEVIEHVKKHVGHGHALDKQVLVKELGDILWYISAVASLNGLTLGEVARVNIAKLRLRYEKQFTEAESINRKAD